MGKNLPGLLTNSEHKMCRFQKQGFKLTLKPLENDINMSNRMKKFIVPILHYSKHEELYFIC